MSHNAANSQQRPPRAEADRDTASSSAAAPPSPNVASPLPGNYHPRYPTGYQNPPPALSGHSHYHQHHPAHQGGAAYSPYADSYGYAGQPYQPARHSVDTLQFARPPPSRSLSQSSGSSSVATSHEAAGASHYSPHYSPSYAAANAPVGHSARTRWAWVPIEVPQTHISDEAHLQYAPYPANFYVPPGAPVTHAPSTSHSPYQQPYGEPPVSASSVYGMPATPPNYTPTYSYHPHPAHYMPPPGAHNAHPHVAAPARASRSGSQHGGFASAGAKADSVPGAGSRPPSNQSSRSTSAQRRTSSNSSGNHSSPHPVSTTPLPHRAPASPLDPQSVVHAPKTRSSQPVDLAEEEDLQPIAESDVVAVSGLASEAELDAMFDATVDPSAAERVPGSGLRPHYHPQQGPRSDWVLWCGNVPQDATVEELWEVFSRLTLDEYRRWLASPEGQEHAAEGAEASTDGDVEEHGVLSIFIISRSNCAFINYASLPHLTRAVKYFHGKQVRPLDPRCPKLVCRVRKKDDEAQAGVAGQRGRGIHVAWLKQQRELERARDAPNGELPSKESPFPLPPSEPLSPLSPLSPPPPKDAPPQVAVGLTSAASYSSSGSASYASTNSSLFRHPAFRHRFFILKSLRTDDLDRSVETGYWATQPHNESVLDQAYRNSEAVYLIFGVNQTGQFHGYAKMAGPIFTSTNETKKKDEQRRRASLSSVLSAASSGVPTTSIPESVEENATEDDSPLSGAAASPHGSGLRHPHPTLEKRDIEAARSIFSTLSVDAGVDASHAVPMTSPLPITPSVEEAGFGKAVSPQRQDTITQQTADTSAHSSTWPYTSRKNTSAEASASERLRLASAPLSDSPEVRVTAEPDEYGVRRIDMEAESAHTLSSQSEHPSLAPSDSASWSSADPRMAEQIALRAVIHNLRLDEKESRGQAEMLENQLRSSSANTDTTATAKGSDHEGGSGEDVRTPPRQSSSDSWGKPFRVEWIRTDPLPFQRVKKLRNPWRDNRQVKVSRDGTELEPGVGRQLLEEWNRLHAAAPAPVDSTKVSTKRIDPSSSAARPTSDEDE
ncbi:hypothetical protein EX895_006328 [Sporisorium graminicola]|uniref:YTH domain-containing protein n=1 Tax=Sporisorium graminicola TaxID=280036 RepID=A0A4U7KPZ5_9BASI|nr:hypothetical protein EX895_006328 [Sporisorium graminicola]TKY85248.1 hypothetical protein EX895_006328 [Sporisorium graminicola]